MSLFKNKYYCPKETSEKLGVHFQTLRNWEKEGKIECIRSPGGKRFYDLDGFLKKYENESTIKDTNNTDDLKINLKRKICYCRVSSNSQKIELENQIKYMALKYPEYELLYDVGSGINFNRKNFKKILNYAIKNELESLVISYKDRLCRIAYELIENILREYSNCEIIIENDEEKSPEEELIDDMLQIVTVFSSRLYGIRSYKKFLDEDSKIKS
jgi:predicted site-specific integrase-resolvase